MTPEAWQSLIIQGGVGAVLLIVLYLITVRGLLRTKFEIDAVREGCRLQVEAVTDALERAHSREDTLLPAMIKLTTAVEALMQEKREGVR